MEDEGAWEEASGHHTQAARCGGACPQSVLKEVWITSVFFFSIAVGRGERDMSIKTHFVVVVYNVNVF